MTRAPESSAALALDEIERILHRACGLMPSPGVRRGLADACLRAARAVGISGPDFLARLFTGEPTCVTALVEASVVAETYFFRHPDQFDLLRAELFHPAGDRPLSVWSAGCATGEEAYSIAMAMLGAGRERCADRVLATDVSGRSLDVARAATYGSWSLRQIDALVRQRWFEPVAGPEVRVVPAVRQRVEFRRHNVVHDPAPGDAFDLVVCRNVLIYFDPPTAAAVAEKLLAAVRPGGLLLLGPVEAPFAEALPAVRVDVEGATAWRRVPPGARVPSPRGSGDRTAARPRRTALPGRLPSDRRPSPAGRHTHRGESRAPSAPAAAPLPRAANEAGAGARPRAIEAAREAARRGDLAEAERIARDAAVVDLCAESWLLLAQAAESRGDVSGAVEAARRALYLDPGLAMAHAALVSLYARLGLPEDSSRARRNALRAIEEMDDELPLPGAEGITAGALRSALGARARRRRDGVAGEGT